MRFMNSDWPGKRVTVMGLGQFGGGAGVARWLATQGAAVHITDAKSPENLRDSLASIDDLLKSGRCTLRLGMHDISDFTDCDLVIANPAVPKPWHNEYLLAAERARVPVTTEIRLLAEQLDRTRTIGITGSAGKSTTSAMIHHILQRAGIRAHLGGNIGGSLLNSLETIEPGDWVVLELSSAMLHWLGKGIGYSDASGWSPRIGVLTNVSPNHIDWHGSFEHYRDCKLELFANQQAGDCKVTADALEQIEGAIDLQIPGRHNQLNARFAATAAHRAIGIDPRDAIALLSDFRGLPHRLQLVAERADLRFYNDSKSTTPEATLLAIEAFDDPARIHLVAGGYDKGSDLQPIAEAAASIAGLYTIGRTGRGLAEAAQSSNARYCETLERAVIAAIARMNAGDVLLLSPGCASWDQFTNYEQRGELFASLVQRHAAGANAGLAKAQS
jgi:UDP-N-acetylmuramoylalanine--D-glutamate ligase